MSDAAAKNPNRELAPILRIKLHSRNVPTRRIVARQRQLLHAKAPEGRIGALIFYAHSSTAQVARITRRTLQSASASPQALFQGRQPAFQSGHTFSQGDNLLPLRHFHQGVQNV